MADGGLRDPLEDSPKDLDNDPSINSQVQETTVTASTTEEEVVLNPASGFNKDHQEVETIGSGSADTDDQSAGPDETTDGNYPKAETEHETKQSFQEGEQGHQLSSESLGEEPNSSPSDKAGGADAHLENISAALPEEASDRPGVPQEPPVVDPEDAQSGPSRAGLESQGALRRRLLAPEAESHQQEIQKLEENKENTQGTIRKNNKKEYFSYGENKTGLTAVLIHIQKS